MLTTPKIAIIGAGPSGLTLARILYSKGLQTITVFEGEASRHVRSQGGSLDLHPTSGQLALKEGGIYDQFLKHARVEGQDLKLADRDGKVWLNVADRDTGKPEIDREKLRDILLDSLPNGIVQWGKRVKSVDVELEDERPQGLVRFEDGSQESGYDLIVGADGAWSKVRPLVTHIPPFYSGVAGIDIRLDEADTRHSEISKMVGRGSYFVFGEEERRVLLCQRNGDGSIRIYAVGSAPESWVKGPGYDFDDVEAVQKAFLNDYGSWAPEHKRIFEDLNFKEGDSITPRALYMLPVGLKWPTRVGVTLLGDAAHLMTPFAGQGVNQAMQDGMELALCILASLDDLTTAVRKYEEDMFPRAQQWTQRTWDSLQARFAPGGIAGFCTMFKDRVKKEEKAVEFKENDYIAET
ncbi:putative salicylate hydroxylase [Microthyrium microscopicum]|uniref:Putative salicylate hydroxylase n=1 Tax=Microthyrium microscopicum TaxID=703497 RepID=A0A6A6UJ80_9PEZI|nr:putative salicylate hydroxylase [Microthyrium microscopicum]